MILEVPGRHFDTKNESNISSESHLRRGGPQNAFREPLGAHLEASGAEKKKLGTALGRFGPKKEAKMDPKMEPRKPPGAFQDASKRQKTARADFLPLQVASRRHFGLNFGTPLRAIWRAFQPSLGRAVTPALRAQ